MKVAYVDTSCLVALAFDEPSARTLTARLRQFDRLISSNLLEAELRSALIREAAGIDPTPLLSAVNWIHPNRPLTDEFQRLTALGHLKGADLWHLACALVLSPDGRPVTFLTLDRKQKRIASRIGFDT